MRVQQLSHARLIVHDEHTFVAVARGLVAHGWRLDFFCTRSGA
jgi:hypothetical protein